MMGSEEDLIDHILNCKEAIILCELCNEEIERKHLSSHMNRCEKKNYKQSKRESFELIKNFEDEKESDNFSNNKFEIISHPSKNRIKNVENLEKEFESK